jgi:hypothetical protein
MHGLRQCYLLLLCQNNYNMVCNSSYFGVQTCTFLLLLQACLPSFSNDAPLILVYIWCHSFFCTSKVVWYLEQQCACNISIPIYIYETALQKITSHEHQVYYSFSLSECNLFDFTLKNEDIEITVVQPNHL